MTRNELTKVVLAAKLAENCRKAYAAGQCSIDPKDDPEGDKGHRAGIDALFMYLLEGTNVTTLVPLNEQNVNDLITDIGA